MPRSPLQRRKFEALLAIPCLTSLLAGAIMYCLAGGSGGFRCCLHSPSPVVARCFGIRTPVWTIDLPTLASSAARAVDLPTLASSAARAVDLPAMAISAAQRKHRASAPPRRWAFAQGMNLAGKGATGAEPSLHGGKAETHGRRSALNSLRGSGALRIFAHITR